MDQQSVIRILRNLCNADGVTQADVAEQLDISPAYLSDVMAGKRTPGPRILEGLGLTKKTVYHQKEKGK